MFLGLGKVAGTRVQLESVGFQLFDRGKPHVLMHGVAGEEELQQIPDSRIIGHIIETRDLDPTL